MTPALLAPLPTYAELDRAYQNARAENARLLTLLAECRRAIAELMAMVERGMP